MCGHGFENDRFFPKKEASMCDSEMFVRNGGQVEKFLSVDRPLFVNVSNHPSSKWSPEQLLAARTYCTDDSEAVVMDVAFPNVPTAAKLDDVVQLAWDLIAELETLPRRFDGPIVIMVQGESTLTYEIVSLLKAYDTWIDRVVAAVSERVSVEKVVDGKTVKVSEFRFAGFRPYY